MDLYCFIPRTKWEEYNEYEVFLKIVNYSQISQL